MVIPCLGGFNLPSLSVAFSAIAFADEAMCLAHGRASAPFLTGIVPLPNCKTQREKKETEKRDSKICALWHREFLARISDEKSAEVQ